jgi:hypothetical protein
MYLQTRPKHSPAYAAFTFKGKATDVKHLVRRCPPRIHGELLLPCEGRIVP